MKVYLVAADSRTEAGTLLNTRLQMRASGATRKAVTPTKTHENRSERTGQGELANRRHEIRFGKLSERSG